MAPASAWCPPGSPGPFRTGVRWNAAVDRLTGAAERHSTACIEFRAGRGPVDRRLVSPTKPRATRWLEPVKAAFRLLADTGFGGERSRGWGRSEAPEFVEGTLPDMILPPRRRKRRQATGRGRRRSPPSRPAEPRAASEPPPMSRRLSEPAAAEPADIACPSSAVARPAPSRMPSRPNPPTPLP